MSWRPTLILLTALVLIGTEIKAESLNLSVDGLVVDNIALGSHELSANRISGGVSYIDAPTHGPSYLGARWYYNGLQTVVRYDSEGYVSAIKGSGLFYKGLLIAGKHKVLQESIDVRWKITKFECTTIVEGNRVVALLDREGRVTSVQVTRAGTEFEALPSKP